MATWARRLSAAQQKSPGVARRAATDLPETLPEGIVPDDQAALRSLAHLARERPGFNTRIAVRVDGPSGPQVLEVEVTHTDEGPVFTALGPLVSGSATAVAAVADVEEHGGEIEEAFTGERVSEMLTDAMVISSDMVAIFTSVGAEALWANDAFVTAIPIHETDRIWLIELLDEWSKGHFEVSVLPSLVQHGRWHGRLTLKPGDDEEIPALVSIAAHRDATGEIEAITFLARDLREARAAEERENVAGTRLAALVERSSDLIIVIAGDETVRYASPAATRSLGMPDAGLDGTRLLDRIHDEDRAKVDWQLLAEPDEEGVPQAVDLRLRGEHGEWRIFEVVVTDLTENPAIDGVVLSARDVTDRVEAVQRLADRAYTDPLTLLPNRMRLLDRMGRLLEEAEEREVITLLLDIDGFALLNERHGSDVGDELLRQVAHRLSDEVRPQDLVARLGGNSFALVMKATGDLDDSLHTADRIRTRLSEGYRVGGETIELTLSAGLAVSHRGQRPEELIADADAAVGVAKGKGGDRIELMTAELRSSTSRRRGVEQLLQRAITEGDGIEVHFQPIVELESGAVVAAEALLRVHDEEGALLSPASFLEAAESSGMIGPLGGEVLRLTCQQLATWAREGDEVVPRELSVNVSPRQLSDPHFPATVAEAIEDAGVEPSQLCLEITESVMLGERGIIDDTVSAVRGMGVSLGLDDFGAGQSSLGYLKRFPIDFVKIDRTLVSSVGQDESDTAIVRATVELSHTLGLQVVAVGVETEEQLQILELLGVDRAQGFYYLPAVPGRELAERIRTSMSA